jgi:acetate kinase
MDAALVVNAGSSSVKFQIFAVSGPDALRRLLKGQVDGIGSRPRMRAQTSEGSSPIDRQYSAEEVADIPAAIAVTADWLRQTQEVELVAVGHRVVHGGPDYDWPVLIDQDVLARLEQYVPLARLHQPNNLAPIRSLLALRPGIPQVACFDTAFHRRHGALADRYAIPEHFHSEGVRRYGFHGLSYEYVAGRLREIAPDIAGGRVIVAHLGSGASMCALAGGRSIESTMGLPLSMGFPWAPGRVRSTPACCSIC